MKLGMLGTLKLLIRALGVFASHQAAIANEFKILNKHIERIYPPATVPLSPAAEEPFLGDDPYMEDHPLFEQIWAAFGACVESQGLVWGGRWLTIVDRPHVELP